MFFADADLGKKKTYMAVKTIPTNMRLYRFSSFDGQ